MKVVVTGASGLIGKALMKRLKADGHEPVALSRPEWDGEKDVAPLSALRGCDAVMHLAGENVAAKRWTSERKKHLISSRVLSARNLKAGLEQAGVQPKLFLSASGIGYFGDRGDEILNEDSSQGHDFLAELCGEWEAAAHSIKASRVVKARFGVVLSRDGGFLEKVVPMFKRLGASRLGSGKHWFSWIHIDDVVEILMRTLVDENLRGPINVVAPHVVTNAQLTEELRIQLNTFRGPPAPAFALRLLYGELSQALLGSQRAIPYKLEKFGYKFKFPTLKEALTNAIS